MNFNPNLKSDWFTAVMQVINNITMLAAILTGAALIREREHGTIVLYLFSVAAPGILIATVSTSMGQFGLIVMPSLIIMNLLSGLTTPMESMLVWPQNVVQLSPSTHFVALSQAILHRRADADLIWPQMLALVAIGAVFFVAAALRFRKALLSASCFQPLGDLPVLTLRAIGP